MKSVRLTGFWHCVVAVLVFLVLVAKPSSYAETLVTDEVAFSIDGVRFDRRTAITSFDTEVGLGESKDFSLLTPVTLVIESIDIQSPSPGVVEVLGANGTSAEGKPFFEYTSPSGMVNPGESLTKVLSFSNPDRVSFSFEIEIYAETRTYTPANQGPEPPELWSPGEQVTSVPLTPVLQTNGLFFDPDGDRHARTRWQIMNSTDSTVVLDASSAADLYSFQVSTNLLNPNGEYQWRAQYFDDRGGKSDWSEAFLFETGPDPNDQDGNGVPDDQEVDGTGDLDIPDDVASEVTVVNTVSGGGQQVGLSLEDAPNVISLDRMSSEDPDSIADSTNRPESMPFGLISFKVTTTNPGEVVKLKVYLTDGSAEYKWYKYDSINGWREYPDAVIQGNMVSLTLQDGGSGDGDMAVNGVIVDPSGIGVSKASGGGNAGNGGGGGGGGCLIATVAYDSRLQPDVPLSPEGIIGLLVLIYGVIGMIKRMMQES
jgi:hypothetical protein